MTTLEDALSDEEREAIKKAEEQAKKEKEREERQQRRSETKYGSQLPDLEEGEDDE
jgi:hypothetical protein